jgi:hypothetical protein
MGMGEWKGYKLGDVAEKFIDYRGKTPPKSDNGVPLVTAKIVKNGKILTPNEFISNETYSIWMTRGFPEINDVVLTTEAPLGEVALLKDKNAALAQRIILIRGKKSICHNAFLKLLIMPILAKLIIWSPRAWIWITGGIGEELGEIRFILRQSSLANSFSSSS